MGLFSRASRTAVAGLGDEGFAHAAACRAVPDTLPTGADPPGADRPGWFEVPASPTGATLVRTPNSQVRHVEQFSRQAGTTG